MDIHTTAFDDDKDMRDNGDDQSDDIEYGIILFIIIPVIIMVIILASIFYADQNIFHEESARLTAPYIGIYWYNLHYSTFRLPNQ